MNIITTVAIGFLIMEIANVATLYFFPESRYANGVGVFTAWNKSKSDPEIHDFVKYLVNWVAGTKLIFILLLVVILLTADEKTMFLTGAALVLSIAAFYWRLFPLIRKMDKSDQLDPSGYSKGLGWMIAVMIVLISVGTLVIYFGEYSF